MSEREHNRDHSAGQAGEKLPGWIARLPNGIELQVHARTKSEARAVARARLGMARTLPVGTIIVRGTE